MDNSRYYSVIEAAELLETSTSTVNMLVNRGELEALSLDAKSNPVFAERHILNYLKKKKEARA